VADVAIVSNYLSRVADVLAIVTTKASGRIEMSDIVRMRGPIGFHLGKEIGLKDALRLADRSFNRFCFL
jgi:hypothetical protein